jgi:hypothetical protein
MPHTTSTLTILLFFSPHPHQKQKTLAKETSKRLLQLEREEVERRGMAREEERVMRIEETTRRLVERKARAYQESGHRLYQQSVGALSRWETK